TPGTCSGRPAASQQVRATSPACGPIVSQQPKITSSTAPGATPGRGTGPRSACAPGSAGWTRDRPPPRFPTGVRTASMMYASAMVRDSSEGGAGTERGAGPQHGLTDLGAIV